jgi:hypothetical protein
MFMCIKCKNKKVTSSNDTSSKKNNSLKNTVSFTYKELYVLYKTMLKKKY